MLTAGELAEMRDVLNQSLPGTAIIHTVTEVSDAQGGVTTTYATSGTADGRLSPLSGSNYQAGEAEMFARLGVNASHVLTVPANTTINEKQRVVFAGVTYDVTFVTQRATWEISRRVFVNRVT
jgi:seryl-tRNA(Sec) selenium transferase